MFYTYTIHTLCMLALNGSHLMQYTQNNCSVPLHIYVGRLWPSYTIHDIRTGNGMGFPFVFNSDNLTEHVKWNCDMTQENDLYLLFNIKICLYINGTREAYWNDIKNIPFQWHFESINIIRVQHIIYRGCLHIICLRTYCRSSSCVQQAYTEHSDK